MSQLPNSNPRPALSSAPGPACLSSSTGLKLEPYQTGLHATPTILSPVTSHCVFAQTVLTTWNTFSLHLHGSLSKPPHPPKPRSSTTSESHSIIESESQQSPWRTKAFCLCFSAITLTYLLGVVFTRSYEDSLGKSSIIGVTPELKCHLCHFLSV